MARYSAAKIIVRYHIGEPNEFTSDLAAFAYFNDIFSLGSRYPRQRQPAQSHRRHGSVESAATASTNSSPARTARAASPSWACCHVDASDRRASFGPLRKWERPCRLILWTKGLGGTCESVTCPAGFTLTDGGGACATGGSRNKSLFPTVRSSGTFTIACEKQGVHPEADAICCRLQTVVTDQVITLLMPDTP